MKKPSVAKLRSAIQEKQRELRSHEPVFGSRNHLDGWCQVNQSVAKRFHGVVYDTEVASSHGRTHTVCVVSTRGSRGGHVVDITKDKGIIGIVSNMTDEFSVLRILEEVLGVGGWQRRK
ncbi:hypothetical protein KJZ67_02435 [Patescibacteria group bacterium]|nr:hypothetical protein [Patescibacteria group bacterium]